jgi:aryl-alcohol dehydrogenase-like predicted oxidoreductase
MDHVRIGRSNLRVSRLGLGAMGFGSPEWRPWVLTEEQARPVVRTALERGITLFDTCDFYSNGESERVLGRLLTEMADRDEVVIATKVGNPMGPGHNQRGYSRKHIMSAVDASLKRLDTDYIDLYQTHIWDPATDIDEMMQAFDDLVTSGKVLYVGATDMPCWQLAKAVYESRAASRSSFISMQHHYNLVWREDEREIIPFCQAEGLGLLPYSPAARGFLADARGFDRGTTRALSDDYANLWYGRPQDRDVASAVVDLANSRGISPAQVALAWVLATRPGAVPIIGPTAVEHVESAVAALHVVLDDAEVERLENCYAPRATGGHR